VTARRAQLATSIRRLDAALRKLDRATVVLEDVRVGASRALTLAEAQEAARLAEQELSAAQAHCAALRARP
jgi:hypothetical protein